MKNLPINPIDLKIDIRAHNTLAFQEIALLVDKPEFLEMLPILRKELEVESTSKLKDYMDVAYEKPLHSKKKKKINLTKYTDLEDFLEIILLQLNKVYFHKENITDEMDMHTLIATEASLVCLKFNRPPYFAEVVKQAVFCRAVDDDTLRHTYAKIIENDSLFSTSGYIQLPQMAILVSPITTYEELKKVFREAKELFKKDKRLTYYQPRIDTISNIKKYRDWYWEKLNGKTYQKIADEWLEKHENENTTYLDVLKAVKHYKKLLTL